MGDFGTWKRITFCRCTDINCNHLTKYRKLEIFYLLRKNDLESIKKYIEKYPDTINIKDGYGFYPIFDACFLKYDNLEIIEFLLKSGADTEIEGFGTALHFLSFDGDKEKNLEKYIKLFLTYGIDINKEHGGSTALEELIGNAINMDQIYRIIKLLISERVMNSTANFKKILIELIKVLKKNSAKEKEKKKNLYLFKPHLLLPDIYKNNLNDKFKIMEILEILFNNGFIDINMIEEFIENELGIKSVLFIFIIQKLKKKIEKLEEQIRYQPGNFGYYEAKKDFDQLIKKK